MHRSWVAALVIACPCAAGCAAVPKASDDPGSLASRAPAGSGGLIEDPSCEIDPPDCASAASAALNSVGIVAKEVIRPIRLRREDGRGVYEARMLLNGDYASAIENTDSFLSGQGFRLINPLDAPVLNYVGERKFVGYRMVIRPHPQEVADGLLPIDVKITSP